jgi:hypothetical protein
MAAVYSFSIPDGFAAGVSLWLSKQPWQDHTQDLPDARVAIKAGQPHIHVALSQISADASAEDLVKLSLPFAQDFLDLLVVQHQLAYRIAHQHDYVTWRRATGLPKLQISATSPITAGMSASLHLIRLDGSIDSGASGHSPNAHAAFRYYRFASSSEDLFEAYRYLFLSFESALDDLRPQGPKEGERQWLGDALRQASPKYSLDLSAFSTAGFDAVDQFLDKHYAAIRCATFHAKAGALLPGDLADLERVHTQLRKLQPVVKQLLKEHFGATFRSSGMTSYTLNLQLESLTTAMWLITSPREVSDLAQQVRSALTASGLDEVLGTNDRPYIERELPEVMDRAHDRFPYDLLPITFDGKRPGYDDQWRVTAAATTATQLRHGQVRSLALFAPFDPNHVFLNLTKIALCTKTVATDLELTGVGKIAYRLRVVLRSFQEFPREFAS